MSEVGCVDYPKDEKGRFLTGNIGGGRPKGARGKLSEHFLSVLQEDFEENGKEAVEIVRKERPQDYLKVIASLMPRQLEIKETPFDDVGDDELAAILIAARAIAAVHRAARAGEAETILEGSAQVVQTVQETG